jgi:hypothetical protein
MGIERADCLKVGELLGIKIFFNEFLAYKRLSELKTNRELFTLFTDSTRTNLTSTNSTTSISYYYEQGSDIIFPNRNETLYGGFMSVRIYIPLRSVLVYFHYMHINGCLSISTKSIFEI